MNRLASLSYFFRNSLNRLSTLLGSKWQARFYLYLAALFSVVAVADAGFLHFTANMKQGAFDMMVRYRLIAPKPDPDIVIVDINEASLAAMAKEYGRWPWPRQVLGEFVEQIEKQKPQAIVFDILFSDPDVYNAESDAYFDQAIAGTDNTFFPVLRLPSSDDALSQVKPGMIPGVKPLDANAQPDATVAVVLPYFKAALESGRLGLHNIDPDADGVTRQYATYRDEYGWKIPSLPLRIAQELKFSQPAAKEVLLNWRGPPFSYRSESFSDVYNDMLSQHKQRPQNEFAGKIVIIGSTAPSLLDIKATPFSQMHPGVEILATAIDNFKHDDFLRYPDATIAYLLLTLAIIWATAWGFYRNTGRDKIDRLFGSSQFILIGISYASINFTDTYINLTGPVTLALAFFTVARLYDLFTTRTLEKSTVRSSQFLRGDMLGVLLLIRLSRKNLLNDRMRERIRLEMEKVGSRTMSVEILKGTQRGLWGLFEDTLAISWLCPADDMAARQRIDRDIEAAQQAAGPLLRKYGSIPDNEVEWFLHEGRIAGGEHARASWRALFAETLLRWCETKKEQA